MQTIFKNRLLTIRKFDDTIINILNAEIPTESFYKKNSQINPKSKCIQFKKEMHDYYDLRENAIKSCVEKCRGDIDTLKRNADTPAHFLKQKLFLLKSFQQELDIEKIHRARTVKAVEERCRTYV